MRGLGRPRGPEFRTVPVGAGERPPPQGAPAPALPPLIGPPLIGPAAGSPPVVPPPVVPPRPVAETVQKAPRTSPPRGRLLVAAALVAALTGAAAGAAGARLFEGSEPAPAAALPRAAPAPPASLTGLSATAARVLPSVVSVETRRSGGSGFVVDDRGHIVTNAHVVSGSSSVTVVLSDGRRLSADVIGADDDEDLAVLEVAYPAELTPATLGRSADLSVGDQVLAIGSPLGLSGTVTGGIVSALDREVRLGGSRRTAVQTDASINPGNSGGPLVNARGEVVGVNTAIAASRGGGNIGIGFAIPIDRAAPIAERIIRN
ncbi:S1C family serine protease [Nonomuraea candida]|uniref:S1C family serine protease n=1 Tax=Nonomuraea candida TaxID=359159 RepID=UPI0005BBF42C|nr:trypsin-like peptidase domain-containing protein [Nonomuraea candida]